MAKSVSKEIAVGEFIKFLKVHKAKELKRGKIKEIEIPEEYPDAIEAIMDGRMVFDDKSHPTLKLKEPLKDEAETIAEVSFRKRIKPSERANVMSGLNIEKDIGKFTLRYLAYLTQLSIADLDRMHGDDYDTINQLGSVF